MAKHELTVQQRRAIEHGDGALLVSAAAGSGKTMVLTQRLLEQVCDPVQGADLDRYLVITYTNAAAAELREKIMDGLRLRLAEQPGNGRLRRQQLLCRRAQIGTIHSFCGNVIRENAARAGVLPDFRVADEGESRLLREAVAEELLESCYEEVTPAFAALLDTMSGGRDDSELKELILDAYASLQSQPDPEGWCRWQMEWTELSGVEDFAKTLWGREDVAFAAHRADYLIRRLQSVLDDWQGDEAFDKAYAPSVLGTLQALLDFRTALEQDWDTAQKLAVIPFARVGALRGEQYDGVKACRDQVKKAAALFPKIFRAPSAALLRELELAAPAVRELLDLVLRFTSRYEEAKRRRGVLDFGDLEHVALRLLVDSESGEPTRLAQELSLRFREVMVDEYQDVNRVQEAIIRAVSRNETNLFMVGDVKQSIYRFRLADPGIFLEKYDSYPDEETAQPGEKARLILSRNFRSRAGVLETVNFLFRNLMSQELGELDYGDDEALYPGREFPPLPDPEEPCVELNLLDVPAAEEGDEPGPKADRVRLEADYVARRIRELKQTVLLSDGEGTRPARWKDFAILLRVVSSRLDAVTGALERWGIPWTADGGERFFDQPEIGFMIALLTVLDNPRQDIPLISVLRSPVFGFTADELAEIRLHGGEDFYDALNAAAVSSAHCADFIRQLQELRRAVPELSCDRLIWKIYHETGLLGIYGAMQDGEERRRRLMLLFQYARDFEQNGFKGLFLFINHLRRRMAESQDLPAPASEGERDAVTIMSIHKSKGLQFPVVILPDLTHGFNLKDTQKPLLLHRQLGVGTRIIERDRRIRYATAAHGAVARRIRQEALSEELRVLYVALTRAEEKLVLFASYAQRPTLENAEKKALELTEQLPPDPQALMGASCFADWILPVALRGEGRFRIRRAVLGPVAGTAPQEAEAAPAAAEPAPPALLEEIRRRLAFRYPYAAAEDLPSKLSPTELKGRAVDEEAALEAGEAPRLGALRRRTREARRPDFAPRAALTAAQKGTAFHLVMQYGDWTCMATPQGAAEEVQRLLSCGMLTPQQAEAVDVFALQRFFDSPEGRRAVSAPDLRREFKFSVLLPASDFFRGAQEDNVLLQGVVDCFFETEDGVAILDFKTDAVDEEGAALRAEEYRGQLDAYAAALESILRRPVSREILFFVRPGKAVYLKGRPL